MDKSQEEQHDNSWLDMKPGETKEERRARIKKTVLARLDALMKYWDEHPDELEDYVVD